MVNVQLVSRSVLSTGPAVEMIEAQSGLALLAPNRASDVLLVWVHLSPC